MGYRQVIKLGEAGLEVEVTGTGQAVLVIQAALSADELRPLSQHLARTGEYQVCHFHRRGYAGSGPIVGGRSIAADAADAVSLLRVLDAAPAHVVGVSYSAAVALSLASSAPKLLRTLALVETPPVGTAGAAEFRQANLRLLQSYRSLGPLGALEQFMGMLVGPNWRDESERAQPGSVAAIERDAAAFFESDIPALLTWRFDPATATRIRCPVLCVGGEESPFWFTEMRRRLARLLPNADDVPVDGADHMVASTYPAQVADLLLRHFRKWDLNR